MNRQELSFSSALMARKDIILNQWTAATLQTYPQASTRFLSQGKDRFCNPIGHTYQESLGTLFDGIAAERNPAELQSALDGIIRIRAVQDFTASQAVGFVMALKSILRSELNGAIGRFPSEFAALEARIDQLALLAFDLFMSCREKIYQIKADEVVRKVAVLQRSQR